MLDHAAIDPAVASICRDLRAGGYAAYLVGGAVRDLLRGETPIDWDVATAATPDQILALFPGSLPTGVKYGTVTVVRAGRRVEVTTFRGEGTYGDGRHPDTVVFGVSIEEDLARRDFTINALAYDPAARRLVDPFGGRRDLRRKLLRTVGDPAVRFCEDALRMVRFYRFVAALGLRPDRAAEEAMQPVLLARISAERIRDELSKILQAADPGPGLTGLVSAGLMHRLMPELCACGPGQGSGRRRDVLRHSLLAAAAVRPALQLRLAALLHDIGKPAARAEEGGELHFYGHEEIGAAMAAAILTRLRYPAELRAVVTTLIRLHMFQLPVHPSGAAIRRLLGKAGGPAMLRDLLELRRADIVATGPSYWRAAGAWRELTERVEEVIAAGEVFSLRGLAVDGTDVMRILGIGPGPEVGRVLNRLLEMVTEEPEMNQRERLEEMLDTRPLVDSRVSYEAPPKVPTTPRLKNHAPSPPPPRKS